MGLWYYYLVPGTCVLGGLEWYVLIVILVWVGGFADGLGAGVQLVLDAWLLCVWVVICGFVNFLGFRGGVLTLGCFTVSDLGVLGLPAFRGCGVCII